MAKGGVLYLCLFGVLATLLLGKDNGHDSDVLFILNQSRLWSGGWGLTACTFHLYAYNTFYVISKHVYV